MGFDEVTVGAELEIPGISRTIARELIQAIQRDTSVRFSLSDDGSLRAPTYDYDGIPIIMKNGVVPSGLQRSDIFGAELVSSPRTFYDWINGRYADIIARKLEAYPSNPRASIHVHISMKGRSWRYVQSLLRWVYVLEAPIFRFAALGMRHRGSQTYRAAGAEAVAQDYNYTRPLSSPIASLFDGGSVRPLIDTKKLFEARTASEMFAAWGRLDMLWGSIPHYNPHRLHVINIVPLSQHGTVEFRVANGVYKHFGEWLRFLRGLCELAEREPEPPSGMAPMTLGYTGDFSLYDLSDLLGGVPISEKIWSSGWQRGVQERLCMHHYRNFGAIPTRQIAARQIWNLHGAPDDGTDSFVLVPEGERPRPQNSDDEDPDSYDDYDDGDEEEED